MLSVLPVMECEVMEEKSSRPACHSRRRKCPRRRRNPSARGDDGTWPADSMASQASSSSKRCCGSSHAASRGEMPKKPASNSSMRESTPAAKVTLRPASERLGCCSTSVAQRSGPMRPTRSAPRRSARHKSRSAARSPGKRKAIPTIAIKPVRHEFSRWNLEVDIARNRRETPPVGKRERLERRQLMARCGGRKSKRWWAVKESNLRPRD